MNRNEEYFALLGQLERETPPDLEGCVKKARRRALAHRGWRVSLASLGGVAAAFVLMVNLSMPFALACARIPGLRELTTAVAFSPSLKAAVQNDFLQYIGQEQSNGELTMKLDYLIFDSSQLHFFYSVSGGDYDSFHVLPTITGPDGEELEGFGITSGSAQPETLADFGVNFNEGFQAPEALRLTCKVTARKEDVGRAPAPSDQKDPRDLGVVATFVFDLTLDPRFTAPGRTYELNEWVTADSQRLLIRSLEVNPTHSRLTVSFDGANTAWCTGLDFYLTDALGNRYEPGSHVGSNSSLVASGSGEEGMVIYYLESPHFTGKAPYTLHLTGADWLDKGKEWVTVDLEKGTAQGLPEGSHLVSVLREGEDVRLSFSTPYQNRQFFSWTFRDEEGTEFHVSSGSYYKRENEDGSITEVEEFSLPGYSGSRLGMKLNYTRMVKFEEEISVTVGEI